MKQDATKQAAVSPVPGDPHLGLSRTARRRPLPPGALLILGWLLLVTGLMPVGDSHAQGLPSTPTAPPNPRRTTPPNPDDALVSTLVTAEETLLRLASRFETLSRAVLNLRLPGVSPDAIRVVGTRLAAVDLAPSPQPAADGARRPAVTSGSWPLAPQRETVGAVDLWRPLLDQVAWFESARFKGLEGNHPGGNALRFETEVGFEGVARMRLGTWRSLDARIRVSWERQPGADGKIGDWQITAWQTLELNWQEAPGRLFTESLDNVLRPPQDPASLRRSQHYEATVKYYRDGMKKPPHPYFAPISVNQKEGLAIADVNGDGFDDIYITVRLGKNMLLINHGDGTYSEQAAAYQLDLPGHTTCALFADFDNDGDLDALLGRSLLRTTYLENRGGKFHQLPIPPFMPMAVISMAAADYNGDGLLDVYLCTYRPAAPSGSGGGFAPMARDGDFDWPDEFFPPEQAREFRRRLAEHRQKKDNSVLDQLGPPNLLLINRGGGRLEPAPENETVGLWRNTLQATWCDYNGDGRPDLFLPNDWGLSVLFRNDGPAGFKDVTRELGLTSYGFSMGASWGDYDNDGRDDLYVSNMDSEAGRRMTARITGLEKAFYESAQGNWLYHQDSKGHFTQVAGPKTPALPVMKAGWSWGGCFADFDNDSFLDLYVVNGYFTAPRELASGLDLESNLWRVMLRADSQLTRPTFRYSPEWKRTPPPDALGPQIDARMVGMERVGDRVVVHSLQGRERNRYFANQAGRTFTDLSGLSGLDNPADGRGFAVLDYDRDGWQDVALVNANQPLFNLYHNDMAARGHRGGVIALRFRGGNRTPGATQGFASRDGFGARVTVDLGDRKIVREHRCGEGWSVQNSATMLVGIGTSTEAASVSVQWPSGKVTTARVVPEGTLLVVHEDVSETPDGQGVIRSPYRIQRPSATSSSSTARPRPVFAVRSMDASARPASVRAYITFTTTSAACIEDLPALRQMREVLGPEGVDLVLVPVDDKDDDTRLAAFNRQWKPSSRLVNLPVNRRAEAALAFSNAVGQGATVPSTVVTDESGHILAAEPGAPNVSMLRQWLAALR